MKQLTNVYELSNGELVKGKANAIAQQNKLDQDKNLRTLVQTNVAYSDLQDDVLRFITDNKEELLKILSV